jgi:PTS system cellobiose-specific IIB component
MKEILLVCSAGMSTSLLVAKMQKVAEQRGYECNIQAQGNSDIGRFAGKVDVVLVGPQIKYALGQIQSQIPDTPIDSIDMRVYGLADGEKALDQAIELMG